jgi:hypothetical protein
MADFKVIKINTHAHGKLKNKIKEIHGVYWACEPQIPRDGSLELAYA